jgi:hypothetical protein
MPFLYTSALITINQDNTPFILSVNIYIFDYIRMAKIKGHIVFLSYWAFSLIVMVLSWILFLPLLRLIFFVV